MERNNQLLYRRVTDGDDSRWYYAAGIDDMLTPGSYALQLKHGNVDSGLPLAACPSEHYIVATLIVTESGTDEKLQKNRLVGQTLILPQCSDGKTCIYTRTLVNGNWGVWSDIGAAKTSDIQDGSITVPKLSADVREKVDNPLRPLFIAAGAEYNDTDADKTKIAFWGETVTHKAGHYYLNGLGDITEEQMIEIYNHKNVIDMIYSNQVDRLFQQANNTPRTFFSDITSSRRFEKSIGGVYAMSGNIEIIYFTKNTLYIPNISKAELFFWQCEKLKAVGPFRTTHIIVFSACPVLEHISVYISKSFILKDSPIISKNSVFFMIKNATPSSAITITLHPDAYARLVDDADIVAALEAQPLVSLVSA